MQFSLHFKSHLQFFSHLLLIYRNLNIFLHKHNSECKAIYFQYLLNFFLFSNLVFARIRSNNSLECVTWFVQSSTLFTIHELKQTSLSKWWFYIYKLSITANEHVFFDFNLYVCSLLLFYFSQKMHLYVTNIEDLNWILFDVCDITMIFQLLIHFRI